MISTVVRLGIFGIASISLPAYTYCTESGRATPYERSKRLRYHHGVATAAIIPPRCLRTTRIADSHFFGVASLIPFLE